MLNIFSFSRMNTSDIGEKFTLIVNRSLDFFSLVILLLCHLSSFFDKVNSLKRIIKEKSVLE